MLATLDILNEERLDARDEQERQRAENVVRLLTEIQTWMQVNPELPLSEYLEQTALISDVDGLEESQDAVSIMTVHASKGLSFPMSLLWRSRKMSSHTRVQRWMAM